MAEAERAAVQTAPLTLALHPYEVLQMSLKVGENWGDVMLTLPHCCAAFNDENAPVDEIVFLFADTHDSDFVAARSVTPTPGLQRYLQCALVNAHKRVPLDGMLQSFQTQAEGDPSRDFYDYLYDACWEYVKSYSRAARRADPADVPYGVYVEITGDNRVGGIRQNGAETAPPKTDGAETEPPTADGAEDAPPMTDEVKMYLTLAEAGVDEGMYNLGVCYEQGDGVAQDPEKAVYWYKKAADLGHAKAQYNLGVCIYNGNGAPADHAEACRLFRLSAEQGDMYAQFNMGVCCYQGDGTAQDIPQAIEWFQKAAAQGHPDAKRVLESL